MTWSDYTVIVPVDIAVDVFNSLISSGGIVHHLLDVGRHWMAVSWESFTFFFAQPMR